MEQTDASAQSGSETAVLKDVEVAYGVYLKAFQDCLRAAGLPDDAAEAVEANGRKLSLEIVSQKPLSVFSAKAVLPDSLQDIFREAFGFPLAITKISLGFREATIEVIPEQMRQMPAGGGIAVPTMYGDVIHPGRHANQPRSLFANEIRFSLEGGVMLIGTFDRPYSTEKIGGVSIEDATWTPSPLSPKQIYGFRQLVQYGEYLNNAQTRIVVDRAEPLPPLDTVVPGFTALNKQQ